MIVAFEMLLSLRHLMKERICLGSNSSRGMPPLVDANAKTLYRIRVCRLMTYIHEQTGRWYDAEVERLIAFAQHPGEGEPVVKDRGRLKVFRSRHYKKLLPYL